MRAGAERDHNISVSLCDAADPEMEMTMVRRRVDKQLVAAQEDERKITLVPYFWEALRHICVTAGA
jgi:hypothetical protein